MYVYVLNYLLLLPQRRLTFITYLIKRITINIKRISVQTKIV